MTAAPPTATPARPIATLGAALLGLGLLGPPAIVASPPLPDRGNPAMNEPGRQPLLASYYDQLDRDGDLEAFRSRVEARYGEATLRRLVSADDVRVRRAAVQALGLIGGFGSNAALAAALADRDPVVRNLATRSLWSIWFRADDPGNNDRLRAVSALLGRGLVDEAHRRASDLIDRAPGFAEAYNQRAIASFLMGHYAESAADCLRALELNPYHFGALGGLAQCYQHLGRPDLALEAYRRLLRLQPHDEMLRRLVADLEGDRP